MPVTSCERYRIISRLLNGGEAMDGHRLFVPLSEVDPDILPERCRMDHRSFGFVPCTRCPDPATVLIVSSHWTSAVCHAHNQWPDAVRSMNARVQISDGPSFG